MIKPSERLNIELSRFSESYLRNHNLKWFQKFYIDREEQAREKNDFDFVLGRLYTFLYDDPKYKEELLFYSAMPVSMFIGYSKLAPDNPMMVNVHFIPPQIRASVFDKIFDINIDKIDSVEKDTLNNVSNGTALKVKYNELQKYLNGSGYGYAIRSYIPERIKTRPLIISYPDWWRVLTFANQHLEKKTVMEIYRLYKKNLDVNWKPFSKEKKMLL